MSFKNEILLLLTDRWCDWEAGYATAVLNSYTDYVVKTIAIDSAPKVSMGGIRADIDYCISDYQSFEATAIVILPGGLSWDENEYPEIADFIRKARASGIPLAAICSATTFLCRYGFLDDADHTGDSLELFQSQKGYNGQAHYIPAQVVVSDGFITANETAAVEFAYEIFKLLKAESDEQISQWYNNFQYGAVRHV